MFVIFTASEYTIFFPHRTLGLTLMAWFQPSRPLRPLRKPRSHMALQGGATAAPSSLLVNVVSALQVPTRKDLEPPPASASFASSPASPAAFSSVAVRPFVEVTFKGATGRTRAAEGANPTWNCELQIPIQYVKLVCANIANLSLKTGYLLSSTEFLY